MEGKEICFKIYFHIKNLPEEHKHPWYTDYTVDTDECLRDEQGYPDTLTNRRYTPHVHGTSRQSLSKTYL